MVHTRHVSYQTYLLDLMLDPTIHCQPIDYGLPHWLHRYPNDKRGHGTSFPVSVGYSQQIAH